MSDGMLRASAVFQSTLSMRRATVEKGCFGFYEVFQSTLSMRRATANRIQLRHLIVISIHALHEESDMARAPKLGALNNISIHALHEESDLTDTASLPGLAISIHALHEESDSRIPGSGR
ncbi:hypothetical protein B5791_0729 [Bifidobacterium pseudocatenulatum]|nr:hypothetical protein B5791_0729 [Bifidobacterium pseudocatenulatum]